MGEYAELMLDGTCCSSCGEYLGEGDGFPVQCAGCAPERFPKSRKRIAEAINEAVDHHTIRYRVREPGTDLNGGKVAPPGLGVSKKAKARRRRREREEAAARAAAST